MLVSSYVNGSTAGSPPPPRDHSNDAKRGKVRGWSASAVRRHTKWLYSIDSAALDGRGFAVTLTIRDCPPTSRDWHRVVGAFLKRMERAGAFRVHYLTEWQKRKVPHLHAALYFEGKPASDFIHMGAIYAAWLAVAAEFGARWQSQDVKPIDGAVGWLQYLSKHAARGVRHYQRQGFPDGWESTGRLWGRRGEWPEVQPMRFDMPAPAYHRYRRLVRSWRIADARAALLAAQTPQAARTARLRLSQARRMLRCDEPRLSYVRGVSEWVGESGSLALIGLLHDEGYPILQRDEGA